MRVLLSIKPEFANKIFEGQKKYEYRKAGFKNNDVKKVIVYASAPVSKVIGEFEIEKVLMDDLHSLWEQTKHFAGITRDYFFSYFDGRNNGYAIEVKNCIKYAVSYNIKSRFGVKPPQSFMYLT